MINSGKKYKAAYIGLFTTFKLDLSLNISLRKIGLEQTMTKIDSTKKTIKKLNIG
jgi:hypothetical protein